MGRQQLRRWIDHRPRGLPAPGCRPGRAGRRQPGDRCWRPAGECDRRHPWTIARRPARPGRIRNQPGRRHDLRRRVRTMTILVTGSAGHLGEALMRVLRQQDVRGIDIKASEFTDSVGSIVDRDFVRACMAGADAVLHTATLHKPHVATHSRQDFVDTNITGTLNLLEEAVAAGVDSFIFTSTTSTFGDALRPPSDQPAAWITEDVTPIAKNIYGATKTAAEDLCRLFHRNHGLPCVVLRTSRFFPEDDDEPARRDSFGRDNLQVCELLNRRVDI